MEQKYDLNYSNMLMQIYIFVNLEIFIILLLFISD